MGEYVIIINGRLVTSMTIKKQYGVATRDDTTTRRRNWGGTTEKASPPYVTNGTYYVSLCDIGVNGSIFGFHPKGISSNLICRFYTSFFWRIMFTRR